MATLRLRWDELLQTNHVNPVASLEERKAHSHLAVISKYPELFKEKLGLLKGTSAVLSLKPNATSGSVSIQGEGGGGAEEAARRGYDRAGNLLRMCIHCTGNETERYR